MLPVTTLLRPVSLALLLAISGVATADDSALPLGVQIDRRAEALVRLGVVRGLVIGTLRKGQTRLRGFGKMGPADSRRPAADSVFEIGSVTKAFTAILLAALARAKVVALDDPVAKYLPAGTRIDPKVTLLDLATHHGGLPRNPHDMPTEGRAILNPFAGYTATALYATLARHTARPGERTYLYSNLGGALLGHALSRAAGKPYEALLVERVCRPLGLTDTRIAPTAAMRNRRVAGEAEIGGPTPPWDMGVLAGAGGLHSSAADLLVLVAACLSEAGPLRAALADTLTPRRERRLADPFTRPKVSAGKTGLGWAIVAGRTYHSGQTTGCHAIVALDLKSNVGVVALANTGVGMVSYLGFAILELLAGRKAPTLKIEPVVRQSTTVLDRCVGEFKFDDFSLRVTRFHDVLLAQPVGVKWQFAMYPAGENVYFLKQADVRMTFVARGAELSELVVHRAHERIVGHRIRPKKPGGSGD